MADAFDALTDEDRMILLLGLWYYRLGIVASDSAVPNTAAISRLDAVARKLGGDPAVTGYGAGAPAAPS